MLVFRSCIGCGSRRPRPCATEADEEVTAMGGRVAGDRGIGRNSSRIGGRYSTGAIGSRAQRQRTLSKSPQAQRRMEHIAGGIARGKIRGEKMHLAEIDKMLRRRGD